VDFRPACVAFFSVELKQTGISATSSLKLILNQICNLYKGENSLNNVDEVITLN
jgi:hypothetical protein